MLTRKEVKTIEQIDMWGENPFETKVAKSIERFKAYEDIALSLHPDGFYLAFSGGKDSQCIYHLAKEAGVKFTAHNNHTTVDPPELIYFMRANYPDVIVERPKRSMWQLIQDFRMPPTRLVRYCCKVLKEGGGSGRLCVTGVRWAESTARLSRGVSEVVTRTKAEKMLFSDDDEGRMLLETCTKKGKRVLNPIIDWSDDDVWQYIRTREIKYCSLYDEGFKRLGCIGCPMAGKKNQKRDFERWPKYKAAYMRAFTVLSRARVESGLSNGNSNWSTAQGIMDWWLEPENRQEKPIDGQGMFDDR